MNKYYDDAVAVVRRLRAEGKEITFSAIVDEIYKNLQLATEGPLCLEMDDLRKIHEAAACIKIELKD